MAEERASEEGSQASLSSESAEAQSRQGTIVLTFPVTEQAGDKIGRYKLLQLLGEGGCGVVYLAEQEEPVRRRVALKLIKLGMDTKSVIARFEAERQALAMMDHPNIAKVLDAGATETGRPFFVMELVRGIRITEYCDQNKLSTAVRLQLFMQVCQAIQHAHQKGIIHRDIKPSNILVTLHDGVPVPKVIDFGIAKATQGRLTDQTLFTAFEQFIGTPAYMSPEQAELSGLDVDTRSDIYALGVLLYELLTGRTPFDTHQLLASGLDVLRRAIREKEPERPSTRLRTMLIDDLSTTARHRQTDAPRLINLVKGDLDWIVMKTLEKDRTRRYETANGLAMDVQRHLSNEPVLARPPSAMYRMQKMIGRNKVVVAAAMAVVLALCGGLGLSLHLYVRERAAHQRAVAAEQEQARLRIEAEKALHLQAELSEQKQSSQKLDAAGKALSEGRIEEAQKLLLEVPPHASSVGLYNNLAAVFARRGEWLAAITNYGISVEMVPTEYMPAFSLATLFVQAGDIAGYERHRARILTTFADPRGPAVAEKISKACLLLPSSPEIRDSIDKMISAAMIVGAKRDPRDEVKFLKGFWEYRQGNFKAAVDWLQKIKLPLSDPWHSVQAYMVLAMAQRKLGQDESARASFAAGVQLAEANRPKNKNRDYGMAWNEALVAQILQREAKETIEK
jgi:tRNA A-37 threonylcarbamoyl transferase component Bud32/tetratricopeptide (TPR) repeat protein